MSLSRIVTVVIGLVLAIAGTAWLIFSFPNWFTMLLAAAVLVLGIAILSNRVITL